MSLCPMECRGRKNQEIKGTSPDPLPPTGRRRGRVYMRRACPKLPVSSLESISKCAVDSVRVAELDNELARAQRAKILPS